MIYGEEYGEKQECRSCKFWTRRSSDDFLKEEEYGLCEGLPGNVMEIDLITGHDGGYIDSIETEGGFYCALHEVR